MLCQLTASLRRQVVRARALLCLIAQVRLRTCHWHHRMAS